MNQTKRNPISSLIVFGALLLSGCGPVRHETAHVIDDGLSRLVRSTSSKAAKSGVKLSEAEARKRALVAFEKLQHDNKTLFDYVKEKGEETVGDCVAKEALHDALKDTQLSEIAKSACFPD